MNPRSPRRLNSCGCGRETAAHSAPRAVILPGAPAFTLIELILVMALLAIVIAVAAPTLSRFFRGRTLHSEAARFLALTRYGQSQAVSEGIPMVLWLDLKQGTYGLHEEGGFRSGAWEFSQLTPEQDREGQSEQKPLRFELGKDLRFEMDTRERLTNSVATIRFAADGSIDEASLRWLLLLDKEEEIIPIVQSRNRLKYEIADSTNMLGRLLLP